MKAIPFLLKIVLLWVGVYLIFRFGIRPPLPSSLVFIYMTLTTIGILFYVMTFQDTTEATFGPILRFLRGSAGEAASRRYSRQLLFIGLPLIAGFMTYQRVAPRYDPPAEERVVHPAPPAEFVGLNNPYRQDKEHFAQYVKEGAQVFFQNCFFCHGDRLDGEGHFAHGFNLRPANFQDVGTIAQLQESFVFWRVSTGGPGLPDESSPWNSAMPRWETMLTAEQRWKAIMFLYDATGHTPRTWEYQ